MAAVAPGKYEMTCRGGRSLAARASGPCHFPNESQDSPELTALLNVSVSGSLQDGTHCEAVT